MEKLEIKVVLILMVILLSLSGCLTRSSDWPTERGNLSNSNSTDGSKPAKISESVWKYNLDDYLESNPVVVKDKILFGAGNSLFALNKETGQSIWKFDADFLTTTTNAILTTPAVNDGRIFFGCNAGTFYSLDVNTGKIIWQTEFNDKITSSPKVFDNVVYFGGEDGYLYAYNADTGLEKWRFRTINSVSGPPAIIDGHVIVVTSNSTIYSINCKTGELFWSKDLKESFFDVPITSEDLIYLYTLNGICALDKKSGDEVFHYELPDSSFIEAPCLSKTSLISYSYVRDLLFSIDSKTGTLIWETKVNPNDSKYMAKSPLLAGDIILLPAGGALIAFNLSNGKELWRTDIESGIGSQLALDGKAIYFGAIGKFLVSMR